MRGQSFILQIKNKTMFRTIILGSAIWTAAQAAKAAYFLENDPAGSNIVSFQLKSGLPSDPIRTSTGGRGAYSVTSTGQPAQVDTLGSEGAVFVSGNVWSSLESKPMLTALESVHSQCRQQYSFLLRDRSPRSISSETGEDC